MLVNDATASGFARSSSVARSVEHHLVGEVILLRVLPPQRGVGIEDADDPRHPGGAWAARRKPETWPCTSPAIASRSGAAGAGACALPGYQGRGEHQQARGESQPKACAHRILPVDRVAYQRRRK